MYKLLILVIADSEGGGDDFAACAFLVGVGIRFESARALGRILRLAMRERLRRQTRQ
jgi:hypothetical protein